MTPKEKAQELILLYLRIQNTNEWWSKVPAKECAIIAVDLRLDGDFIFSSIEYGGEESLEYWIEVKKEIEKL